jgi:hypothetical protein
MRKPLSKPTPIRGMTLEERLANLRASFDACPLPALQMEIEALERECARVRAATPPPQAKDGFTSASGNL